MLNDDQTAIPGKDFEEQTAMLLRLFPGSKVEQQVQVLGKKVDVMFTTTAHLIPQFSVAVECKDWIRPLTREQCVHIIADYYAIVEKNFVDQFLLITRNGIVPNAQQLFDGRRFQHLTLAQLGDRIFDPLPLIENMKRQYLGSLLSATYIPQHAYSPDLAFASSSYPHLYNDFIDFAIESGCVNLQAAQVAWMRYSDPDPDDLSQHYTERKFSICVEERTHTKSRDLKELVLGWVASADIQESLSLLGSYGTGKSSFARHLAYVLAEKYMKDQMQRIPFLIELKEFGSHQDIRGLVTHELVNRHGVTNGSFELFQSLNAAGRFVLILDGFDEMKQGMTSDSLLFNFNQIGMLTTGKAKVLLCGRPTIFENLAEQQRVMRGAYSRGERRAKYIQIQLAPFHPEESCTLLECLARNNEPDAAERILSFVREIRLLVSADRPSLTSLHTSTRRGEILDLVSRPVHLPMLASVLPRRQLGIATLNRSLLYSEFIDAIIEREMLKRRAEFTTVYSAESRREFARDVAVEMARKGDSRSIRTSEIPARLFEKFVVVGRPLDSVRRDMISACFLERKGPDILFFPHKSFGEFLLAEYIRFAIRQSDSPDTDSAGFRITDEILDFLSESLSQNDWYKVAAHVAQNSRILLIWIDSLDVVANKLPDLLLDLWAKSIPVVSARVQRHISLYLERIADQPGSSSRSYRSLLQSLLQSSDDTAAVHAYRALSRVGVEVAPVYLYRTLGQERWRHWIDSGWLKYAEFDLQERSKLLERFLGGISQITRTKSNT